MRKLLLTSLLAVATMVLCQHPASAFFSVCGTYAGKYSFTCPRVIFGIDSGAAAPYQPVCYGPPMAYQQCGGMPWCPPTAPACYGNGAPGAPAHANMPPMPNKNTLSFQMGRPQFQQTPNNAGTMPVSYVPQASPANNYGAYYPTYSNAPVQHPHYWYGR